tara:strand:- start:6738 stop:6983 length:246 start_codon:yes stop_codon:yes gene_type:complete
MKFTPQGIIMNGIIKLLLKRFKLDKVLDYVENDNEVDIQLRQAQKTISKQGKVTEENEKDIAILKERINKLEKKCQTSKKK